MSSSAKNYLQNGEKWVIGGEIELVGNGVITKDGQPVVGGDGGGLDIPDGSITTSKIASKAVTDDKLANPKVDVPSSLIPKMVIGTTLEGNELGIVPYEQTPTADHLAMYQFGGQLAVADPQADGDAANKKYVDGKTPPTMTMQEAQEGVLTAGRLISPQTLRAVMPSLSSISMLNEGATLEECVTKINQIIETIG